MNKKKLLFALIMSLLFSFSESLLYAADDGDTQALNEFYEQNGDCYLLIGNSKSEAKSGVYQLNNLTNGVVKKLYSPGNAYGITAGLKLDDIGKPEKSLYTFIAKDRSPRSAKGRITTRPMLTSWSYGTWQSNNNSTPNNVAPHIVHRYHTLPNDASTGVGNHTTGYGLYKFDYKCIPCSIKPVADGVDEDGRTVYRYKIGEEWYHTWDYPAYSRYTYCTKGTWRRFASTGYTDIWMNDDAATRSANDPDWYWTSTRYGGWVHYDSIFFNLFYFCFLDFPFFFSSFFDSCFYCSPIVTVIFQAHLVSHPFFVSIFGYFCNFKELFKNSVS